MPFLKRGKARYERKRFVKQEVTKPSLLNPGSSEPTSISIEPAISLETTKEPEVSENINLAVSNENNDIPKTELAEDKISYQSVNYRVPKEERLLDLPLEEEVSGENYIVPEEASYRMTPVENPVPIGVALKKKRRN